MASRDVSVSSILNLCSPTTTSVATTGRRSALPVEHRHILFAVSNNLEPECVES